MTKLKFPYGREEKEVTIPEKRLRGVVHSGLHGYDPGLSEEELVANAMARPIGSPILGELAKGVKKVVILCSDHTRPVPSKVILPKMLKEIREVNPSAEITLLVATGCHRETTQEELYEKFGGEIAERERIVVHDCDDVKNLVFLGTLPSGGELWINRLASEAELLLAEGFIEPHFFAGFSGGRKSVLPGIAGRKTVLANHCSQFIAHERARTGVLEGNPIHEDMLWAAKEAKLRFIVNVVVNSDKKVVHAVAGDVNEAHLAGCAFLIRLCRAQAKTADIVITSNGGYPLDQNIYQAVKGMTAAEAAVREGGVILMLAKANDGHGGEEFLSQLTKEPDLEETLRSFMQRGRDETAPDQWQTQILIRVLLHARVVFLSDAADDLVRRLHMIPAHSLEEGLRIAEDLLGDPQASILAIPDGVSVIF